MDVRAHAAHLVATSPRSSPARTSRRSQRAHQRVDGRTIPLGVYARKSLWPSTSTPTTSSRRPAQGFAFYEEKFDYAVPVREVRPALRARVQRGRHGERRRRDVHRDLRVPLEGDRRHQGAPRRHDPARARPHVVRRPRHHEVVERPVAQRVVRRVGVDASRPPRPPSGHEAWTTFSAMEKSWAYRQDQLPSTHPIVATINDLEDVQVNFDGITYAKGGSVLKQLVAWVGIDDVLRRRRRVLQEARVRQHRAARPARRARGDERPRPHRLVEAVARDRRRQHAAPEIETDADGVITAFAIAADRAGRLPDHPPAPPRRRLLQPAAAARSCACTASSSTSTATRTEVAELVGLAQPDLVLLNDDDLAYAKIRLDDASLAGRDRAPRRRSTTRSPARSSGARPGMRPATPRRRRATTSTSCSATSRARPSRRRCARRSASCSSPRTRTSRPRSANATREQVADALWAARRDGRGRQRQPVPVRQVLRQRSPRPPAQLASRSRALRDGATTLDGLEIDTDLVWELLVVARRGRRGRRGRDRRGARGRQHREGRQFAAQARAALPTLDGKQAAWDSLIDSDDLPNTIVRSSALGFTNPRRRGAARRVRPAVLRHAAADLELAQLPDRPVPDRRPVPGGARERARCATRPGPGSRRNPDAPAALRRLVIENLAGVERALAVQERDAQ